MMVILDTSKVNVLMLGFLGIFITHHLFSKEKVTSRALAHYFSSKDNILLSGVWLFEIKGSSFHG